jgi:hypothetical protein
MEIENENVRREIGDPGLRPTSSLYPKLDHENSSRINYMLDKQKLLQEKLTHYKKIKGKWATANTVLKSIGISISCALAGASILTIAPLSIPIAAAILSGVSLGNITLANVLVEGFTSKRKRYFKLKCDHVRNNLNKLETFFIKCKEDNHISPNEFEQFQKLLKEFEEGQEKTASVLKEKDVKNVHKKVKKDMRQQQKNVLYKHILQDQQQKLQ